MDRITFEVCIDSVAGARAAEQGGGDRLELCSALSEGGLTPSIGLVQQVALAANLPIMMMIRPRGGNFVYDDSEIRVMMDDIQAAKSLNVHGVVFGCLDPNRRIDLDLNRRLLACCRPLSATFHRAFDEVADPLQALAEIRQIGFDRVLTSGTAPTALAGVDLLRKLVAAAGDVVVMPGAGVRPENAATIIAGCGAREIHGTASETHPLQSSLRITSVETVASVRSALDQVIE